MKASWLLILTKFFRNNAWIFRLFFRIFSLLAQKQQVKPLVTVLCGWSSIQMSSWKSKKSWTASLAEWVGQQKLELCATNDGTWMQARFATKLNFPGKTHHNGWQDQFALYRCHNDGGPTNQHTVSYYSSSHGSHVIHT